MHPSGKSVQMTQQDPDFTAVPPAEHGSERVALLGHGPHRGYRNPSFPVEHDPELVQPWSDDPFGLNSRGRGLNLPGCNLSALHRENLSILSTQDPLSLFLWRHLPDQLPTPSQRLFLSYCSFTDIRLRHRSGWQMEFVSGWC